MNLKFKASKRAVYFYRSANTIRSDDTFLTTPTTVKSEKSPQNKKKNKFNQQSKRSRSLSNQAKPFPARVSSILVVKAIKMNFLIE